MNVACVIQSVRMKNFLISAGLFFVLLGDLGAETWTLENYLKEVYAASNDLKKAEEDVTIYRKEYFSSLASFYLPAITVNVSNKPYSVYNDPKLEFRKDNTSAGISAGLNLFNNFKDKTALDISRLTRKSSEQTLWRERQRVTLEAMRTYYDVLRKRRLREVVKTSLKSYEEQYAKVLQYYKDGMKSYSDVLKSELNLRTSQLQEITSAERYRNALMDFNMSLYRSPRGEVQLDDVSSTAAVAGPSLEADLAYALENRVEIKLAGADLDKSRLDLRKSRLNILPNLSADASYNRQGLGSWGRPSAGTVNPVYSLALSLSLPLGPETFSDVKNYTASSIGLARQERALYALKLGIERELASQALALETALKTYEVSRMKADIARQSLEIVKTKYAEGRAGFIDLSDSQSADLGAQSDLANALYDLLLARANYDKAVGRRLWKE